MRKILIPSNVLRASDPVQAEKVVAQISTRRIIPGLLKIFFDRWVVNDLPATPKD
jgi:hypothetical protein